MICVTVFFVFRVFFAEELDEQLPADGERLVEDAVDFVVAGLRFTRERPARLAGVTGGDNEQRDDGKPDRRQDPVLAVHDDNRRSECHDVGED